MNEVLPETFQMLLTLPLIVFFMRLFFFEGTTRWPTLPYQPSAPAKDGRVLSTTGKPIPSSGSFLPKQRGTAFPQHGGSFLPPVPHVLDYPRITPLPAWQNVAIAPAEDLVEVQAQLERLTSDAIPGIPAPSSALGPPPANITRRT